ncbi:MAG: hypothetical protein Q9165_000324 [Trypethelium subeluteriae]
MVNCIDNSGAAIVECVKVLKQKRHARIGDRIIAVVQKQRSFGPESGPGGSVSIAAANKVRRGDIRHAVVVRTAKKYQRPDGSVVKFDDNACVLINKNGEPIGSRLNGIRVDLGFPKSVTPAFKAFREEEEAMVRSQVCGEALSGDQYQSRKPSGEKGRWTKTKAAALAKAQTEHKSAGITECRYPPRDGPSTLAMEDFTPPSIPFCVGRQLLLEGPVQVKVLRLDTIIRRLCNYLLLPRGAEKFLSS